MLKDIDIEEIPVFDEPHKATTRRKIWSSRDTFLLVGVSLFLVLLGVFSAFLDNPPDYTWLMFFGFLSITFTISVLLAE